MNMLFHGSMPAPKYSLGEVVYVCPSAVEIHSGEWTGLWWQYSGTAATGGAVLFFNK